MTFDEKFGESDDELGDDEDYKGLVRDTPISEQNFVIFTFAVYDLLDNLVFLSKISSRVIIC